MSLEDLMRELYDVNSNGALRLFAQERETHFIVNEVRRRGLDVVTSDTPEQDGYDTAFIQGDVDDVVLKDWDIGLKGLQHLAGFEKAD